MTYYIDICVSSTDEVGGWKLGRFPIDEETYFAIIKEIMGKIERKETIEWEEASCKDILNWEKKQGVQ